MFGRRPRTKSPEQVLAELDALYALDYRGGIFIVDANFIGNKREVKKLLPELRAWNDAHESPFFYFTEASIDLAQEDLLRQQMVEARFIADFVGIETPSMESLKETRKFQNLRGSLVDSVKTIQRAGLMVWAGFIIGFDNDTEDIFDRQIEFITEAGIHVAMIGLLVALPGTPLFKRLPRLDGLPSVLSSRSRAINADTRTSLLCCRGRLFLPDIAVS